MIDNFTDIELENEQWRDIDGYDGAYQVSDLGRVRSLKFGKVRVLRPAKDKDGYLLLQLWRNGQVKTTRVHRLVADAFIENTDETKTLINHIDECKQNNRVNNLEYCTTSYNMNYNGLQYRRWINRNDYKRRKIEKLYDKNLSIPKNLEIFRAHGVECCRSTVVRLRKDLGLTKHYKPRNTN